MPRRTARIGQDEVRRMVKAVQDCGLPIARVVFDGETVSVIVGESEGNDQIGVDGPKDVTARIREPAL